jgi:superfamily II DNA or RNA helicase
MGGMTPNPLAPVQVLSIQTAIRRLPRLGPVDLVIADEAHHATSQSWRTVLDARPTARLLGVTATPTRTDGTGLADLFDVLHCGPDMATLTRQGYLAPYRAFGPPLADATRAALSHVHTRMGDYAVGELSDVMEQGTVLGDAVEHYQRLAAGRPAMVFCVSVRHAELTAAAFQQAGFRFASVDGSMDVRERDRRLAGIIDGSLQGLTSCDLISEGVDVPGVEVAILLRPTQSLILHLQQIGRALRPMPGKTALILDHAGNLARHGFPDDPREWSLEGTRKRKPGERLPPMQRCPSCYAVFSIARAACPECGFAFPERVREDGPTVRAGSLRELTAEDREASRLKREAAAREVRQARTREALEAIARARKYHSGWVDHILRTRGARR